MKRNTLLDPILIASLVLGSLASLTAAPVIASAPPHKYTAGMVAYWRFEEGNGSVATDSVNGHDGTIYEAARTTGQVGGALHFDGTYDRVEVPSDPAFMPQGKFTTEAWIYPESTISEQEIFSALLPAYYQVLIINNDVALNY